MALSISERRTVKRLYMTKISSILHLPRLIVIYTLKRFKETRSHSDKPKSDLHNTVSTFKNVNKIQKMLKHNSIKSIQKTAANLGL